MLPLLESLCDAWMIDGMSHRNSKNVGKLGGKDAKGEERKGRKEKKRLYYHSEEGKKEAVMTIKQRQQN